MILTLIVIVLLVFGGGIILWLVATYNGLVKMRNRVQEAWSDIDVQLKRRYDLIPNLMETVKGYAKHEEGVFTKVTEARAKAISAQKEGGAKATAEADNMLTGALKSLFAVTENYPDLKANQNFLELQRELSDTENKVQASRRFYNGNTRDFNTKQQQFPTNLLASIFGFKPAEFFEVEGEEERKAPQVKF
ncbi:MAG: LemA family protein [Parcubacteria group bacterium]